MANWNWQKIAVPGCKQLNLPDFNTIWNKESV